jgi:hypothetical protein
MKKEDEEAEFCLNSRRYIELMALYMHKPPNSCLHQSDNFFTCQDCSYYEKRKPSRYLKRLREGGGKR